MAGHERLSGVKSRLDRLRRDSAATAGDLQRVLQRGARRLAQHESHALDAHLQAITDSLRAARGPNHPKAIAAQQLELLRDLVQRVVINARESLAIVAATRMELVTLMKKSAKKGGAKAAKKPAAKSKLAGVKAKAKKAVASVKAKARKAGASAKKAVSKARTKVKAAAKKPAAQAKKVKTQARKAVAKAKKSVAKAQKSVKKSVAQAQKSVKKDVAKAKVQAKKVVAQVERKVAEAAAPVMAVARDITPSPLSRAFLATSAGKKEAEKSGITTPPSSAPTQMGLSLPDTTTPSNS